MDADDSNNVFNVAFRTTPVDDTGVAHILEHTALCGSKRFPVRDPFFNMLKRSLSTFMNAMTAADYTMYPFSTPNEQDYFNLLGVYLDAAFFPRLERVDFLQEGHRLEFKDTADPESGLMFKGVVFNEMKGAMGSQGARLHRAVGAKLFPTSTYHWNSGGDPVSIPELTHDDLVAFHRTHYHPSNARFFSYGDLPLEATLQRAQDLALGAFDALDVSALDVTDEVRYTEPQRNEVRVPADAVVADPTKQSVVSVAWLQVNQIADGESLDSFALRVASDLLLSGPQATFYAPLLESKLGSGFAPGTGYASSRRETSFSVGLKGVADDDIAKVEEVILATVDEVAREGFPRERVNATLHQLELGAARVSSSFGIQTGMAVMSTWVHGGDALRPLRTAENAAKLVRALDADPNYWQSLLRRHLVENKHRVTTVATADKEYDAKLEKAEEERVAAIEEGLTGDDKQRIVEECVALKKAQEAEADVELLPTLTVDVVPRLAQTYPSKHEECRGVPLQVDVQPTNGLTFAKVVFDVRGLPDRLVPYLDLFTSWISDLGTEKMDYRELSQAIKATTGGISAEQDFVPAISDADRCEAVVSLRAHALDRNVATMFELLGDVATSARWTTEEGRVEVLLTRLAAAVGSSLSSQGNAYAASLAKSAIRPYSAVEERSEGLPLVVELQRLVGEGQAGTREVCAAMAEIAAHVFGGGAPVLRARLSAEEGALDAAREGLGSLLDRLTAARKGAATDECGAETERTLGDALSSFEPGNAKTFVAVPTQTNYCVASVRTVPYEHPDSAALYLLAQAMSTCYLHREIREKGGAYGGGCSASPMTGTFTCSSYRDPGTLATLRAFEGAVTWAATPGSITAKDLQEAHLRAFKSLDAPLSPQSRGTALFTNRLDDASRQRFRDALLACTPDSLRAAAEAHLVGKPMSIAIVGNSAAVPVEHSVDGWTVLGADGKPLLKSKDDEGESKA